MFDHVDSVVGLSELGVPNGESIEEREADQRAYELTCRELADGRVDEERHVLPDLESIPTGPFLLALMESVDRSSLNGFDLVRSIQARERLISQCQAGSVADVHELAHAAPGDTGSDPERLEFPTEHAADELRPALTITRRAAENRMAVAFDLRERLPRVWELLHVGSIDLARARVIANGTAHLEWGEAREVADQVADRAPRLTTGQLAAWIRRLCVESDPERARDRAEYARELRSLVIEPTCDGTANLHLLDIDMADARAVGRRVNAQMLTWRRDGDTRSHDNMRADIAVDLLLGSDPTNGGRGMFDMRVNLATLAGLEEKAAEIPGMGPVIADVAREYADRHPNAEWHATVCDDNGDVVDVITTKRRPTRQISRLVRGDQPVCAFPGCRMPASDCDYDHLLPVSEGGHTSRRNGGPKCRHDHILQDHGWSHRRVDGRDVWISPHGHVYTTEKPP